MSDATSPARRSRRIRDAILLASFLTWSLTMYAVWRVESARALAAAGTGQSVFSETFERDVEMAVEFKVPAMKLSIEGTAVRRTREPHEGRLIVRHAWDLAGHSTAGGDMPRLFTETYWDRDTGLYLMVMEVRGPSWLGGLNRRVMGTRVESPRLGDVMVLRDGETGERMTVVRIPEGADLSAGILEPAPVGDLHVGAKWSQVSLNPLTSAPERVEVEVVEEGRTPAAGRPRWGFKAVAKVEKDTGMYVERSVTWYDAKGSALVQVLKGPLYELTLRRVRRLEPSDEAWEEMDPEQHVGRPRRRGAAPAGSGGRDGP